MLSWQPEILPSGLRLLCHYAKLAGIGMSDQVRLTEYSHGAGCGCKISPQVLAQIVEDSQQKHQFAQLVVGNESKDDAAVVDLGDGTGIISTTDFFMPIVDDPFDFGKIAATNAISDIYAMGGEPLMAIAILGWPVEKLDASVAKLVVSGGRQVCIDAGIPLAGGHSIDAPEPIFGLAVTGRVPLKQLKRNDTAKAGDRLYLSKPLGIGILTTAQKQKHLKDDHQHIARDWMCRLNNIGVSLAQISGVSAITDVTGFGLLGHLLEVCEGSQLKARLYGEQIPVIPEARYYLEQGCIPGGTRRNYASYGHKAQALKEEMENILCDPQTSGGLLVAVSAEDSVKVEALLEGAGLYHHCIGELGDTDINTSRWVEVS
jgi:selenide,water dikinase